MDLTSLLTVRWDAPYRILASVLGLTLVTVSAGGARFSYHRNPELAGSQCPRLVP